MVTDKIKIIDVNNEHSFITVSFPDIVVKNKQNLRYNITLNNGKIMYIGGNAGGVGMRHLKKLIKVEKLIVALAEANRKMLIDWEKEFNEVIQK